MLSTTKKRDELTKLILENDRRYKDLATHARVFISPRMTSDVKKTSASLLRQINDTICALREAEKSQRLFSGIYDILADAVVRVNSCGFITDANPAAESLFKSSADNIVGRPISFFFGFDWKTFSRNTTRINNKEINFRSFEDKIIQCQLSMTKISHNAENEEEYIFIIRDISELVKLRDALIDNNMQLDALYSALDESKDAMVITNCDNEIVFVNKAFTQHTGYSLEDAVGHNPNFYSSGIVERSIYENMWETLDKGETWQGSFVNRHKDGTLLVDKTVITPIFQPGKLKPVYYVAVKHYVKANKTQEVSNETAPEQSS